jgi:hypothetical protein
MLVLAMQFSRGVRRDSAPAQVPGASGRSKKAEQRTTEPRSSSREVGTYDRLESQRTPSSECINWEFSSEWR